MMVKDVRGDYDAEYGALYSKMDRHIGQFPKVEKAYRERGSYKIGIMFDNPHVVEDKKQMRWTIGFQFAVHNDRDRADIENCMAEHGYRLESLPDTESLYGRYDYRFPDFVAFYLGTPKFFRTIFAKYFPDPKYQPKFTCPSGKFVPEVELYDAGANHYFYPIENQDDFWLTRQEAPKMKAE